MDVFRSRLAAIVVAAAFVGVALPACGDDDGQGAAEEIEKGAEKGADEVEKEGNEIDDDVRGKDESEQRDK
jgi:hypothetical protein